jgi:Cytochrome c554 and c-prime
LHGLRVSQSQAPTADNAKSGSQRAGYVGDAGCLPCHSNQSLSYAATSHHLTTQMPNDHSILGSFKAGSNILTIREPAAIPSTKWLYFEMLQKEDSYYESSVSGSGSYTSVQSGRIDLVVGSGVHGQSYLHWQGNQLFELPVSYWTVGQQWMNSPGYKDGTASFSRPITPRCMECHATYIKPLSSDPQTNRYLESSLAIGISCETCHGPGADHIAKEKVASNISTEAAGKAILNPASFSRDRQVDSCALCHNGTQREENATAFTYEPGNPLDGYLTPFPSNSVPPLDVHGDEVGLLKRSRCYLSSPGMSCSTCHNVHAPERPAAAYSDRCLTCHQWESCGVSQSLGRKIITGCIDCHMPEQRSTLIVSETAHKVIRATMRNHWIKVYPQLQRDGNTTESSR